MLVKLRMKASVKSTQLLMLQGLKLFSQVLTDLIPVPTLVDLRQVVANSVFVHVTVKDLLVQAIEIVNLISPITLYNLASLLTSHTVNTA